MNWWFIIGVAVVIELVTFILRFGFHLKSRRWQKDIHLPWRIHHLYIGLFVAFIGLLYTQPVLASPALASLGNSWIPASFALLDIGLAIALSDVMHHFFVLPYFHQDRDFP